MPIRVSVQFRKHSGFSLSHYHQCQLTYRILVEERDNKLFQCSQHTVDTIRAIGYVNDKNQHIQARTEGRLLPYTC